MTTDDTQPLTPMSGDLVRKDTVAQKDWHPHSDQGNSQRYVSEHRDRITRRSLQEEQLVVD
jgi:hypothetical protein